MKIMVVGSGGREHAITKALARSPQKPVLHAFMSNLNPGMMALCESTTPGKMKDVPAICADALTKKVDLVVIGPEEPLMHGLADELTRRGIPCVGPQKKLAEMEGNKLVLRSIVDKYFPEANPDYRLCRSAAEVASALHELGRVAVKPLGLTSGKGVRVMGTQLPTAADAEAYANQIIENNGEVLLEELLEGEEFSQMVFTDGVRVVPMPLAQDAKFAFEGDTGLMTGGMGSYTMADHRMPFVSAEARQQACQYVEKLIASVEQEYGMRYHGVLYGQFMLTRKGPRFVEVNVRYGDPESINVLSVLKTDAVDVFTGMVCGLPEKIEFERKASVCKYLVPEGYPENPRKDVVVRFDQRVVDQAGVDVIYAGAEPQGDACRATGSRFAAVLAVRDELAAAENAVENAITQLGLSGVYHRRDIATAELIQKRTAHMRRVLEG